MRCLGLGLLLLLASGCVTTRQVTISATPPDAMISIDGVDRGTPPVHEELDFRGSEEVRRITASRPGYVSQTIEVNRSDERTEFSIDLQPRTAEVKIHVTPVPATITVDGKEAADGPTSDVTLVLPFPMDPQNQPTVHTIRAMRRGYQPAERVVKWDDPSHSYTLSLDAMRKDLSITTNPAGAQVWINGQLLGVSPISSTGFAFPVNDAGDFEPQKLKVSKPGYEPVETSISWDDGKSEYHVDLIAKSKIVRITTDPPGATVKIDGKELAHDASGAVTTNLSFPPINDKGDLRVYQALVSKKTPESEWLPEELTIAWDDGKSDYSVSLAELKTRVVPLLVPKPVRTDDGWQIVPQTSDTVAMKDVTEGATAEPPVRIFDVPRNQTIGSLAISPDGQNLAFSTLTSKGQDDFHGQIEMIRTDGSGQPVAFGDGKSLDLTPSFSPEGSQIVFASNRGGRRLSIWQVAVSGADSPFTRLTSGRTTDLWPTIDSDPHPRLFYQAMVDGRPDPRLYMSQIGTSLLADLTQSGGEQPRVSPKADALLFTQANSKTGRREICRMSDRGGAWTNVTNTPEFDNCDPFWSKDGSKIAFASDRGEQVDGRRNYDIWIMDISHPDKPQQITHNASLDDCPAWDPEGRYLYFRSNRGGTWGIWRIALK